MRLKDKVAIVTGGAQGLGEALCYRLAKEGCFVTVADIKYGKAQEVAERIVKEYERPAMAVKCDVTKEEDVKDMVEKTVERYKRLDIMIANAGILIAHDITEFPLEDWKKVIDVNLTGYFLCARESAKVMVKQRSGVIIQINSKSGKKGSFRNCAYSASKFGGIGLTQSIALDLAPYNVRVVAVCPGDLLDSPLWRDSLYDQYAKRWGISKEEVRERYLKQIPLGRACTYDDVANVVVFLASDEASYITGDAVNVTGGVEMR
ncbi:MAG: sorbitol-6-phosphate dehydrogenase [Dictyoglomus sp.]|nr:sorbitol-6-phosphate dehydrogenase [Dictyoglomus sp.]MDW8188832.1 sorbitol-6-phosphate dehydrogenase [Dictyoglomus sp.]